MLKAPDGYTFQGMQRGWMRAKISPKVRMLKEENRQLKETLAEIVARLEKVEEKTR